MALIKRKTNTPAPAQAPAAAEAAPQMEAAATQSYALMVPEIRTVNLENVKLSQNVLSLIPENIAIANKMLPLYLTDRGTTLVVAMADSRNDDAINNIGVYTGLKLEGEAVSSLTSTFLELWYLQPEKRNRRTGICR